MDEKLKFQIEVNKLKKKLIKKAKKNGITENFGQKEIRRLESKYNKYEYWSPITQLKEWCTNFDLDTLKNINEGGL